MDGFLHRDPGFVTQAIHAGQEPEQWDMRACITPIVTSLTFKQDEPGKNRGYIYGRDGNPSRSTLEQCLASLEKAKHAFTFSSGMATITTVTALLSAGDHIIAGQHLYGNTRSYFTQVLARWNIATTFVDMLDLSNVEKTLQDNTKMVWLETPTNPIMKVIDIRSLAEVVHKKDKSIMVVIDNSFLTPYFQLPLSLGADLVVTSVSKYVNGHSDSLLGCLTTNRDDIHNQLRRLQNLLGAVPSPFDCYLAQRGLKTLALRMDQHMKSGLKVAQFLESHACIEHVNHPGLPRHPQHALSKRQCFGHSGILSFCVKGGLEEAKKFISYLKVFTLSGGFGGTESQIELPCLMTQACVTAEERLKGGITDSLIRMSVGLEDIEVLIKDLEQALNKTYCC